MVMVVHVGNIFNGIELYMLRWQILCYVQKKEVEAYEC